MLYRATKSLLVKGLQYYMVHLNEWETASELNIPASVVKIRCVPRDVSILVVMSILGSEWLAYFLFKRFMYIRYPLLLFCMYKTTRIP